MNRWIYIVGVPVLALLLGAFCFAEVIASGFASEGCRFAPDDVDRRSGAANEWLLVQGFMLLVLGLILLPLLTLLRRQRVAFGKSAAIVSITGWLGLAAFAIFTFGTWNFLHQCSSIKSAVVPSAVLPLLPVLIYGCLVALLASLTISYISGLSRHDPRER